MDQQQQQAYNEWLNEQEGTWFSDEEDDSNFINDDEPSTETSEVYPNPYLDMVDIEADVQRLYAAKPRVDPPIVYHTDDDIDSDGSDCGESVFG